MIDNRPKLYVDTNDSEELTRIKNEFSNYIVVSLEEAGLTDKITDNLEIEYDVNSKNRVMQLQSLVGKENYAMSVKRGMAIDGLKDSSFKDDKIITNNQIVNYLNENNKDNNAYLYEYVTFAKPYAKKDELTTEFSSIKGIITKDECKKDSQNYEDILLVNVGNSADNKVLYENFSKLKKDKLQSFDPSNVLYRKINKSLLSNKLLVLKDKTQTLDLCFDDRKVLKREYTYYQNNIKNDDKLSKKFYDGADYYELVSNNDKYIISTKRVLSVLELDPKFVSSNSGITNNDIINNLNVNQHLDHDGRVAYLYEYVTLSCPEKNIYINDIESVSGTISYEKLGQDSQNYEEIFNICVGVNKDGYNIYKKYSDLTKEEIKRVDPLAKSVDKLEHMINDYNKTKSYIESKNNMLTRRESMKLLANQNIAFSKIKHECEGTKNWCEKIVFKNDIDPEFNLYIVPTCLFVMPNQGKNNLMKQRVTGMIYDDAKTIDEALDKLSKRTYDVVIVDEKAYYSKKDELEIPEGLKEFSKDNLGFLELYNKLAGRKENLMLYTDNEYLIRKSSDSLDQLKFTSFLYDSLAHSTNEPEYSRFSNLFELRSIVNAVDRLKYMEYENRNLISKFEYAKRKLKDYKNTLCVDSALIGKITELETIIEECRKNLVANGCKYDAETDTYTYTASYDVRRYEEVKRDLEGKNHELGMLAARGIHVCVGDFPEIENYWRMKPKDYSINEPEYIEKQETKKII